MEYSFLIGDNLRGMGKKAAIGLRQMNFDTVCCSNDYTMLTEQLKERKFSGLLFFGLIDNTELHSFVAHCHEIYPDMRIYPLLLDPSDELAEKLCREGADRCLTMPLTEYEICDEIVYDFFTEEELPILPKIAGFLSSHGMPNMYIGFKFLCAAIEMAVDDPTVLKKMTDVLYRKIGERMNVSVSQADRAMRIFRNAALKKGVKILETSDGKKLTNKKMITVLSREFARSIGFSLDRFDR